MDKRNILVATTRAERGGAPKHVVDLIDNLKAKYEVSLAIGEEGYVVDEVRKMGVPVYIIPTLKRDIAPLKDLVAIRDFALLIKRLQPDLIHVHTFKAGFVGRLAGKLLNKPVVYTPHAWSFVDGAPRLWRIISPVVERFLGMLTYKVICVSHDEMSVALAKRVLPSRKMVVIHNGISDDSRRAQPQKNVTPVRLIMVARFVPQKAQDVLIAAIQNLPNAELWLVGEGPLQEKAKRQVEELALSHKVHFLGSRDNVADLLSQSHIMVLATNWEGFPLITLEAMRAGLPVVASDVGGVREAVVQGETGLLVPPGDMRALQRALEQLISSPDLRGRMGLAGRKCYEEHFSIKQQIKQTVEVYESVWLPVKDRRRQTL